MKPIELPWAVKFASGMLAILAVSITVEFLRLAIRLCRLQGAELGGGGWGSQLHYPRQLLVLVAAVLFSPALVLSWLSAYRRWRGKESVGFSDSLHASPVRSHFSFSPGR